MSESCQEGFRFKISSSDSIRKVGIISERRGPNGLSCDSIPEMETRMSCGSSVANRVNRFRLEQPCLPRHYIRQRKKQGALPAESVSEKCQKSPCTYITKKTPQQSGASTEVIFPIRV